jgi:hypothetical protein
MVPLIEDGTSKGSPHERSDMRDCGAEIAKCCLKAVLFEM